MYHGDKDEVEKFLPSILDIAEDDQAVCEFLQNAVDLLQVSLRISKVFREYFVTFARRGLPNAYVCLHELRFHF